MTPLQKRLQALEARPPKADAEHDRRFGAAIDAMLATVSWRNEWAPSKVAPFYWVEQPSDMDLLVSRIKSQTTTEADAALMNSWPKCHLSPETLVTGMDHLMNEV